MKTHHHASHLCRYHFVWIPKYRRKTLIGIVHSLLEDLITYQTIVQGGRVLELAILPDHVHLFCELPPSVQLDTFIGKLKSFCTSQLYASLDFLPHQSKKIPFWARGYFVGTCGVDTKVIERYIESQKNE